MAVSSYLETHRIPFRHRPIEAVSPTRVFEREESLNLLHRIFLYTFFFLFRGSRVPRVPSGKIGHIRRGQRPRFLHGRDCPSIDCIIGAYMSLIPKTLYGPRDTRRATALCVCREAGTHSDTNALESNATPPFQYRCLRKKRSSPLLPRRLAHPSPPNRNVANDRNSSARGCEKNDPFCSVLSRSLAQHWNLGGAGGGRGQCKRVGRRNVFFADTGLNILCPCGLSRRISVRAFWQTAPPQRRTGFCGSCLSARDRQDEYNPRVPGLPVVLAHESLAAQGLTSPTAFG